MNIYFNKALKVRFKLISFLPQKINTTFTSRESLLLILALSVLLALSGCEGYAVTLNDQPVYEPEPLYATTSLSDPQLANCIKQTIEDKQITQATELTSLICTSAGIETLEGIEEFTSLEKISFANNQLSTIAILYKLKHLIELNIEENPNIKCDEIDKVKLAIGENLTVKAPKHCL